MSDDIVITTVGQSPTGPKQPVKPTYLVEVVKMSTSKATKPTYLVATKLDKFPGHIEVVAVPYCGNVDDVQKNLPSIVEDRSKFQELILPWAKINLIKNITFKLK